MKYYLLNYFQIAALIIVISTISFGTSISQGQINIQQRVETPQERQQREQEEDNYNKGSITQKTQVHSGTTHDPDSDDHTHIVLIPNFDGEEPPKLEGKLKDGTYQYNTVPSPQHYGSTFQVGNFTPTKLNGSTPGITYSSIYGSSSPFYASIDAEWQFYQSFGKLAAKTGLGFFTAKGYGRFLTPPNAVSDTVFTLYGLPVSLAAVYHVQFKDGQVIVPYGEGGIDYFGLLESRNDKASIQDSLRYGGAGACHWGAGIQFQLDFIDREALWDLDNQYGINHIYLVAGVKQYIGLSNIYNLTGLVYQGGFLVEF